MSNFFRELVFKFSYVFLMLKYMPQQIFTTVQYECAVQNIEELDEKDQDQGLSLLEESVFEMLVHFVQEYETDVTNLPKAASADILKDQMESKGVSEEDLLPFLETPENLAAFLEGKGHGSITVERAKLMARYFNVGQTAFIDLD